MRYWDANSNGTISENLMKRNQLFWKRGAKWADEMENACVPFRRLFSFFHNAKEFSMIQRLAISAALSAAIFFTCSSAQAQFGGVQVQVGGYGTGVRIGNLGYSNGQFRPGLVYHIR